MGWLNNTTRNQLSLTFDIGLAIILIPGGFEVEASYATGIDFYAAFALYVSDNSPVPVCKRPS